MENFSLQPEIRVVTIVVLATTTPGHTKPKPGLRLLHIRPKTTCVRQPPRRQRERGG